MEPCGATEAASYDLETFVASRDPCIYVKYAREGPLIQLYSALVLKNPAQRRPPRFPSIAALGGKKQDFQNRK